MGRFSKTIYQIAKNKKGDEPKNNLTGTISGKNIKMGRTKEKSREPKKAMNRKKAMNLR